MCTGFLFSLNIGELWNPVNMSIVLTKLIPFLFGEVVLDIRIFVNVII